MTTLGGAAGAAGAGVAGEGGWENVAPKQESGRRCGRAHTGGERGHTLMKMLDVDEDAERSYFDEDAERSFLFNVPRCLYWTSMFTNIYF